PTSSLTSKNTFTPDTVAPASSSLSVYTPPTTGILSRLPKSWVPYAELVRLDKPTGTYYLLLPCIWSTLLASSLTLASPLSVLGTCFLFTGGAFIMRGAGCAINDIWDRRIDPLVTRTKFRPLARGAISTKSAVVFTGTQLLAGLGLLANFPTEVFYVAMPSMLVVTAYPAMKRYTNYPQVVLGAAFSWGALLGFPAMGVSLLEPTTAVTAGCLYLSNVAWTVLYDTIYAQQDLKDDLKAGVKSTAVAWGDGGKARAVLAGLGVTQLGLLTAAGVASGMGPCFFVGSVGGAALGTAWMIKKVRFGVVEDCWGWFKWCAWAVGGVAIGGGLAGEYV
ncbi:4-hydroxybenzoate polyprenyl transferase, partial [Ascodesmis nigricans]